MTTINSVIGSFAPQTTPALEDAAIDSIATLDLLNGKTAEEIVAMPLPEIEAALGSVDGVVRGNGAALADQLLTFLRRYVAVEPQQPAQPQGPIQVEISQPAMLEHLGLSELLEFAQHNPERKGDVLAQLQQRSDVAAALLKTSDLVVPNEASDGFDAALTSTYITGLAQGDEPALEVNGRFPISLEQALGIDLRRLVNLLTGELLNAFGLNRFGQNLMGLYKQHPDTYLAVSWARGNSTNPKLQGMSPNVEDEYGVTEQLLANPTGGRWATITRIYQTEKAGGRAQEPQVYRSAQEGNGVKKSDAQLIDDAALDKVIAAGKIADPQIGALFDMVDREDWRVYYSVQIRLMKAGNAQAMDHDFLLTQLPEDVAQRINQAFAMIDMLDTLTSGKKSQKTEAEYRELARGYLARPQNHGKGSNTQFRGVVKGGRIGDGAKVVFLNPLIIEDLYFGRGCNLSGSARIPNDISIHTSAGCSNTVTLTPVTWKSVAEELGLT